MIEKARVGNADVDGNYGSLLTDNTECDTSGVGPNDAELFCPLNTRGKFVTLQRTLIASNPMRPFLCINEIEIHVGIENGKNI